MKKLHAGNAIRLTLGLVVLILHVVLLPSAYSQGYGQQIAVMKMMNPGLKSIGVFGSSLSDKNVQDLTRAGMGQNVQVVIGRPKDAKEISAIYKKMVSDKSIQIIWLPDASDKMMVGVGFEYLRSTALPDKIGLFVPSTSMLSSGGVCSVQVEEGKITAYVNNQIAGLLGLNSSGDASTGIAFIAK